jgi:hypothetical protein
MSQQATAQTLQNITRASHTLPICYQGPFTSPNGEIFVQFLDKDKPPKSLHPLCVSLMNHFYTRVVDGVKDDAIEKFFSRHVENDYATVAKRIKSQRNGFTLEPNDVAILLKFVASQVVRSKSHLLCINEQAGMPVPPPIFLDNMLRKMKKLTTRWVTKPPDLRLWTTLPNEAIQFITGDDPVICFADSYPSIIKPSTFRSIINIDELVETPHSGFIVPLSPYIALTVHNGGQGNIIKTPDFAPLNSVRHLNRCIYEQCVQFVAALDSEQLDFHVKRIRG